MLCKMTKMISFTLTVLADESAACDVEIRF